MNAADLEKTVIPLMPPEENADKTKNQETNSSTPRKKAKKIEKNEDKAIQHTLSKEDLKEKSDNKKEARESRKKIKRIEESRCAIKTKSREKGKVIKKFQDRQNELEESRNQWKDRYKQSEKENAELNEKYAYVASLFGIEEEQLRLALKNFEECKKKRKNISQ
jgi:hypothetical protein